MKMIYVFFVDMDGVCKYAVIYLLVTFLSHM